MRNKHYYLVCLVTIGLLLSLSSCTVDIDPKAANSIPAILAVLFEYLWVIIVLIASMLFRFIFVTGIGLTTWGGFHILLDSQTFNHCTFAACLSLGILMSIIGLILTPKIQLPYIRISNKPLPTPPEYKNDICWKTKLYEGIIGVIFAVIAEIIIRII